MSIVAFVIGHLGGNAEIKQIGGKPACKFSVASNDRRDKDAAPTWVSCTLWRDPGRLMEYLIKGKQVAVHGELSTWKDKDGGERLQLRVDDIQLIGGGDDKRAGGNDRGRSTSDRDGDRGAARGGGGAASTAAAHGLADDDIPFATCDLAAEPSPIPRVLR